MVLRPREDYGGYADCYPQNGGGGGGHHFYESIKNELESFRLRGGVEDGDFSAADLLLNDDTSSIASKKRIDSMFKTTASVAGDRATKSDGRAAGADRRTKSLVADGGGGGNDYFADYGYAGTPLPDANKNTVQEKIEQMFAEISSSELDTDVSMDSAAATAAGSNKFHVQYIGCAGLSSKISSLEGLQRPVRDMYFGYRENQHVQHYPHDDGGDGGGKRRDFSGLLEISAAGLTIRYRDERGDTVHRTNPFPSIAVWAALKYVCRKRSPQPQRRAAEFPPPPSSSAAGYEYAFLPLIADPDGSDKAPLFRDMDPGDRARLDAAGDHAPVFAVVTRKAGKRLECHGFACETENDALLMAANLYGALVAAMSSIAAAEDAAAAVAAGHADDGQAVEQSAAVTTSARRVIRHRNGFTSMSSTAGSSVGGGDVAPALPPPRPPRRNKKSVSSAASSTAGDAPVGSNAALDDVSCSDAKTFRMTVSQSPSLRRGVCNSGSSAVAPKPTRTGKDDGGGDILTKVAIPRSRSFLNTNGLASGKYSRRATGCGIETAAADRHRRRSNGSGVMGFSDMFNELRVQEGLNNMDDILNAIINVEGMSYNDLKPIYREFLVKLSMTLTKDELYQRTKAIMTEQKRKRNKRRPSVTAAALSAAGRGRRLNDKLRGAFGFRAVKSRIGAAFMPGFCKRNRKRDGKRSRQHRPCSCAATKDVRSTDRKPADRKPKRRAAMGKRPTSSAVKGRRLAAASSSPVCSTSDDSDFFAAAALRQRQQQQQLLQQQQQQQQSLLYRKSKRRDGKSAAAAASEGSCLHPASSGYFSCSECSAGAADDKCYCGGGGGGGGDGGDAEPTSLVSCSCDSDSCADSDKCYCGRPRRPRNIFDELKSRGFAASESSVSRADSPGTAWKKNELLLLLQRHDSGPSGSSGASAATVGGGIKCGVESSKSLEYLQVARRPTSVDQHYSSVAKPVAAAADRMKVYRGGRASPVHSTTAAGSSSSPASSLSAATMYSSSSAVGVVATHHHRGRQRRSGSSGSDNFRAIDYTLFATNSGAAAVGRKSRGCGNHYRGVGHPSAAAPTMNKRSHSSEAVHLTGCRVYHQHRQTAATKATATRRHSVHHAGDDVLSSFFKSDIENSLGYYP